MEYEQALKIIMERKSFKNLLHRLLVWDEKDVFTENQVRLGMDHEATRAFANRYNLKCKPAGGWVYRKRILKPDPTWDKRKTLKQNALVNQCSVGHARMLASKYSLTFKRAGKRLTKPACSGVTEKTMALRRQVSALRNAGVTYAKIAKMYGFSRQYIHTLSQ